jgi:hypothetical protein
VRRRAVVVISEALDAIDEAHEAKSDHARGPGSGEGDNTSN